MTEIYTRRAQVGPTTLDRAARTVEAVLSTGADVTRAGPRPDGSWGRWIERLDLSGIDPARLAGRPVLRDHHARVEDVVGRIERARLEGGALVALIRFDDSPAAETLLRQVAGGFISAISIGYQVKAWQAAAS